MHTIIKEMQIEKKVMPKRVIVQKIDFSKIKWKKICVVLGIILGIVMAILVFQFLTDKSEKRTNELMGKVSEYYEFSN